MVYVCVESDFSLQGDLSPSWKTPWGLTIVRVVFSILLCPYHIPLHTQYVFNLRSKVVNLLDYLKPLRRWWISLLGLHYSLVPCQLIWRHREKGFHFSPPQSFEMQSVTFASSSCLFARTSQCVYIYVMFIPLLSQNERLLTHLRCCCRIYGMTFDSPVEALAFWVFRYLLPD